jgi:hypothetical protein
LRQAVYSNLDILSALKDGDSFCKTAMSRREDIVSCIDVTIILDADVSREEIG